MATYSVETRNGSIINVPDYSVLHIDGLEIIGDQTTDWNEPYNKNFLTLDKKIMAVENLVSGVSGVDLTGINTDIGAIKTEIVSIKDSIAASGGSTTTYDDTLIQSRINTLNGRVDTLVLTLNDKVDKVSGKGLSTEDYTSAEKAKLSLVEAGAQVNSVLSVAGKTGNVGLVIGDVAGLPEALASGLVNDVTSVAGRKGDVILGVSDIAGLESALGVTSAGITAVQTEVANVVSSVESATTVDKAFDYFRDGSNVATYLMNGNVNDSLGTKHGVATGISYADGKTGKAAVSSVNSKIAFGNVHGNATTVVVSGWVKLTNPDSSGSNNIIFGFDKYNLVHYRGGIGFNSYNGDCYGIDATGFLNVWKHMVVEFTQGAYGKLWVDGVEQVLTQRQGVPNYSSCKTAGEGFNIFATGGASVSGNFGMVDSVRVFNRSRTMAEIQKLYSNIEVSTIEDLYTVVVDKTNVLADTVATKVTSVSGKQLSTEDYTSEEKAKLAGLDMTGYSGDILPAVSSTYNIGSATQRWKGIYVDEAYLAVHTLYLGDTPILGTEQDTVMIKASVNQSINMQTSGTGTTDITSQNGVQISTSGTNADVKVQATGTNSKVRFAGSGGIEFSSPVSAQSDISVSGNLTVSGNIVHNGAQFIVNATTVTAKDNIIVVNQGEVGTGVTAGKAGIQVDRGEAADYQLVFDEVTDKFVVGAVGGIYETIATREYVDSQVSDLVLFKQNYGSISEFTTAFDTSK